ncbi:hypothetical protein U0070_026136 [Myodes glareolus]|uniref:Piwi-like protein 4 n=1 Tax=Myodes glareolus TaxID=447135 RepID=A0AAW0H4F0_MYOGA
MYQIGRNFYKPSEPVEIPQYKLSLWPGFAVSVSHFESRLLLNADVSYKVLRNETVLEFMTDLCLRAGTSHFTEMCQKQLVGLTVLTRYNNKTYRIDDIDWSVKPTQAFQKRDGSEITYVDYYKQQYNITLSDLNQPVLVSLLKRKRNDNTEPRMVHLIPELCFLTGMSSQATSDFHLMRAVAEETRLSPMARQQQLARLVDDIQRNQMARFELESWGLQFGSQLSLTGRVVPSEKILLQDHTSNSSSAVSEQGSLHTGMNVVPRCHPASAADWSKDMRSCRVLSSEPLNRWMVICCSRAENLIEGLLSCLRRVGGPMGFNVSYPKIIKVDERPAAFLRAIQLHVDPDVQLVMCILPSNQKNYYDSIKKYLSSDCPTPSQCVLSRTLTKQGMMMSVATKIAMQMTCKLGGELWAVEIPVEKFKFGFVSGHIAVVTWWFSRCVLQRRAADIADCLKVCMTGALNKWYKHNHDLPSRIIVYRDGVGNGQLKAVLEYEIPQLLSSMAECGSGARYCVPPLSLTLITCMATIQVLCSLSLSDPHHMSSSNTSSSSSSSSTSTSSTTSSTGSSSSGGSRLSVVVVRKRCLLRYDFYLVSQTTNRGTVNPTYYNVIYDDNGLKPDHMQRLTFKLCHLYYNWQGIISVPAPCQYAHKLTFLVAQSIHKEPSLELTNNLFYL